MIELNKYKHSLLSFFLDTDYYNGILFDKDKGLIKLLKNTMGKDDVR